MPGASEIDQVIGQAYDCVFEHDGWDNLFASYAKLVGGDSGLIYVKPRDGTAGRLLTSLGYAQRLETYLSHYEAVSPLIAYYRPQREGHVRALGDYAFSAAYRATEYFQDWVRPQGYGDFLGAHLVQTPQLYAWLGIRRPQDRGVYSTPEVRTANRVARHLGRVIKIRFKLEMERNIASSIRDSLDVVGFGVLIVDVNGKVLMANRAADAMLRSGDGLKSHHGRLVCERPRETAVLHDAIHAVAQPLNVPADFCVSRTHADHPLTVHVVPNPSFSAWSGFAPPSGVAAVFVIDPQIRLDNVEGFATAYGLTTAERRVLRVIVQCGGLVDAADKLRVALPTARTHLQHIFEKTNVSNQAELVRLVMFSPLQSPR